MIPEDVVLEKSLHNLYIMKHTVSLYYYVVKLTVEKGEPVQQIGDNNDIWSTNWPLKAVAAVAIHYVYFLNELFEGHTKTLF